ncbi:hypothetical protein [Janibacter melonis]|uniref:hypothetical protein n=1 Tax=Janibacter melonis TaxID=262209 RepID=UPI00355915EE
MPDEQREGRAQRRHRERQRHVEQAQPGDRGAHAEGEDEEGRPGRVPGQGVREDLAGAGDDRPDEDDEPRVLPGSTAASAPSPTVAVKAAAAPSCIPDRSTWPW